MVLCSVSFKPAIALFEKHNGTLRMADALRAGISRRTLYGMHEAGVVERLSRGVYRLASLPSLSTPDLVTVATRIPKAVVCLISALAFHELTTQVPHAVDIAVPPGTKKPNIDYPPINIYRFSGEALTSGIDYPQVDGHKLRIYCAEKSIADAFKFRNKIGTDVAVEALKTWRAQSRPNFQRLAKFSRVCRVQRVMRPYLDAIT